MDFVTVSEEFSFFLYLCLIKYSTASRAKVKMLKVVADNVLCTCTEKTHAFHEINIYLVGVSSFNQNFTEGIRLNDYFFICIYSLGDRKRGSEARWLRNYVTRKKVIGAINRFASKTIRVI